MIEVLHGDCREVMATLPENSVDAVVCDPPYELTAGKKGGSGAASLNLNSPAGRSRITTGFMGMKWDGTGVAFDPATWAAALRVLKPGGHLLSFGGSRTHHRIWCAVEDAGFEIRDTLFWCYGSGFPKSLDVSKALDKAAGQPRAREPKPKAGSNARGVTYAQDDWTAQNLTSRRSDQPTTDDAAAWKGWGTALKPAAEPIVLARKPLSEATVIANVRQWGTGALNVDACRVPPTGEGLGGGGSTVGKTRGGHHEGWARPWMDDAAQREEMRQRSHDSQRKAEALGRWPANVVLDEAAGAVMDEQSGECGAFAPIVGTEPSVPGKGSTIYGHRGRVPASFYGDNGGASRFFYCAKASPSERGKFNTHPTVKPLALMRWLVRLVTPPRGTVLDPFAGSGSTMLACDAEGFGGIAIEREAEYIPIIQQRLASRPAVLPLEALA